MCRVRFSGLHEFPDRGVPCRGVLQRLACFDEFAGVVPAEISIGTELSCVEELIDRARDGERVVVLGIGEQLQWGVPGENWLGIPQQSEMITSEDNSDGDRLGRVVGAPTAL